jgi:hypothetical protein
MRDAALGGLDARLDTVADRSTLHENDGMMTILARDRSGQTQDVSRLRTSRHQLKARRREMMALVNDEMTVVRHQIRYFAATHEALDQREIYDSSRLAAPAANGSNILRIDIEECPETLDPLVLFGVQN